MKTKIVIFLGLLVLTAIVLPSSLQARHHSSSSVQLQFGANFFAPQPCYRERHIHHYHREPRYVYVTPAPCYREEVHIYSTPGCPHCCR